MRYYRQIQNELIFVIEVKCFIVNKMWIQEIYKSFICVLQSISTFLELEFYLDIWIFYL